MITPTRDRKAKQQRLEEQRLRIDTEAAAQAVPGTFLDSDPGQGDGRFWGPPSGIEEEVPSEERSLIQEHAPFDSSESQATSSPPPPFEEVLNQSQRGPELPLPTRTGNSESEEERVAKDIIEGELSPITPSEISTTTNDNKMGSDTMPVRGERGAPSFDPTVREELPRYFEDLEDWFKCAKVEEEDKRGYVVKYVPMQTAEEWKNLPEFQTKAYEELKKMILNEYPEVISIQTGSIVRLKRLCKENQRISEEDLQVLLDFKHAFLAEAAKLTKPPTLLANHTLVTYFTNSLTGGFKERLFNKLDMEYSTWAAFDKYLKDRQIQFVEPAGAGTTPRTEDMYPLKQVAEMAEQMARMHNPGGTMSLSRDTVNDLAVVPTVKTESPGMSSLRGELEDLKGYVASFKDTLSLVEKSVSRNRESSKKELEEVIRNVMSSRAAPPAVPAPVAPAMPMMPMGMPSYGAPPLPRPYAFRPRAEQTCYYCKQPGHIVAECTVRQQDLTSGKVILNEAGRLQLPDGSALPWDPSRPIKERVDDWYKKQGITAQQAYLAPPSMVYSQLYQPASSLDEVYEEQISMLQQELDQKKAFLRGKPVGKTPEEVIEEQRQMIAALQAERDNALSQGFD